MIFVVKLPSRIKEIDFRKYFEKFGRVNEIELLRETSIINRLRGFAFVTFGGKNSARRTHNIRHIVGEVKSLNRIVPNKV